VGHNSVWHEIPAEFGKEWGIRLKGVLESLKRVQKAIEHVLLCAK
jgi:hypothetical protein